MGAITSERWAASDWNGWAAYVGIRTFCVEALQEALARFERPEIFNTDQGGQFTSTDFTDVLRGAQVRISMDGRGRCMDNVFIERLLRA